MLLPLYAYPGYALTETGSGAVLGRQQGYLAVTLPAGYSGTGDGAVCRVLVLARGGPRQPWRASLPARACTSAAAGRRLPRQANTQPGVSCCWSRHFSPRRRPGGGFALQKRQFFAGLAQALSSNRQLQFGVRTRIIWSYSKGRCDQVRSAFLFVRPGVGAEKGVPDYGSNRYGDLRQQGVQRTRNA